MEKRSEFGKTARLAGVALAALFSPLAQTANVTVFVTGSVLAAPACVLNGNSTINVNFGNALQTTNIDGSNYTTPVPFTLSCTGNPSTLRLRFQGGVSSFASGVLATNITDLGIRLLKPNNSTLNLDEWFQFTYSATPPAIKAVPVKRPGATLPGGAFSSSATLLVEVL
ncbi:fimbrial protein [Serratia aquatilis]|uniref:Fimbrial protein n=1 Tax=Serratia aquatilis TaxID=1737515 RepID=A0ABV6EIJ4_9GAMM